MLKIARVMIAIVSVSTLFGCRWYYAIVAEPTRSATLEPTLHLSTKAPTAGAAIFLPGVMAGRLPPHDTPLPSTATVTLTPIPSKTSTTTSTFTPSATVTASATQTPSPVPSKRRVHVYYTSDEHGYMKGIDPGRGAANMVGLWADREKDPQDIVVILSGGDNWLGPDISSWYDGQSMLEVMNAMGYDAAVVGNHDLEFGLATLKTRLEEANFPYLGANIRFAGDNSIPVDLGIQPYALLDFRDIQIGLIGLANIDSLKYTTPLYTTELVFLDYVYALREYIPILQDEGADLIFVPTHICVDDLYQLAELVNDLEIHLLGGGHCHEIFAGQLDKTVILSGGQKLESYAYAEFEVDPRSGAVTIYTYGTGKNEGGTADSHVAGVVDRWQQILTTEQKAVIGYLNQEIPKQSPRMKDLFAETWLKYFTDADVALIDINNFKASLPAGEITAEDVSRVMPADHMIVEINLTGSQILNVISTAAEAPAIGGLLQKDDGVWLMEKPNNELEADQVYTVLVNSYMYFQSGDYKLISQYNPGGYNTGIDARTPVIEWVIQQGSTTGSTLDDPIADLGN